MSTPAHGIRLARNGLLNFLGLGIPLVVAVFAIPLLIAGLGTERFGLLTIAWMAIGYFSLFDLGLGRALTQLVAERIGSGREQEAGPLIWTALAVVFAFGCVGGLTLLSLAPWLIDRVLRIPAEIRGEGLLAFQLLAVAIPAVVSTSALRGILEAMQRFGTINAIRLPMGIVTYAGPLFVLPFTSDLAIVVAVLVVARMVGWIVHLAICVRILPQAVRRPVFSRAVLPPLLRFGGWMTVSNVISPLMVSMDRFLIGALVSLSAVAYYVTPYEVVSRLWLVPTALLAVSFPAFALSYGRDDTRLQLLFDRSLRAVFLAVFPIVLVIVALAPEGLTLWVGPDFAANGFRVMQWLAAGVLLNCIGQVAFALVQGVGRPDLTGKLHLAELPLYAAVLWWLLGRFGIEGVAIAWTLRVAADTLFLLVLAARYLPEPRRAIMGAAQVTLPALAAVALVAVTDGLEVRLVLLGTMLCLFGWAAWTRVLTAYERAALQTRFVRLWPGSASG